MLLDGISLSFGTILRLLLLCNFFMWDFACVFLRFFQLWTGAKLYGCRNKMFKAKMFQIDWTGKREPQKGWSSRQDLMQPDEGQERDSIPWIGWHFGKRFLHQHAIPLGGKNLRRFFSAFTSSPFSWMDKLSQWPLLQVCKEEQETNYCNGPAISAILIFLSLLAMD